MDILFYIAAVVAVIATLMAITRYHAVHALLYLIISFLSIALIMYLAGAPFIAALEVIIYAGAIMVLFIFMVMMLNLGSKSVGQEKRWMTPGTWIGPVILVAVLLAELMVVLISDWDEVLSLNLVDIQVVGTTLYTKYILAVELAGLLLLVAVLGAYHLGSREKRIHHRYLQKTEEENVT